MAGSFNGQSFFRMDSLSRLTSINLGNEGAKLLQEMFDAIKLALEKGTELEKMLIKRVGHNTKSVNNVPYDNRSCSSKPLASNVHRDQTECSNDKVKQSEIIEPQMPVPIRIKKEFMDVPSTACPVNNTSPNSEPYISNTNINKSPNVIGHQNVKIDPSINKFQTCHSAHPDLSHFTDFTYRENNSGMPMTTVTTPHGFATENTSVKELSSHENNINFHEAPRVDELRLTNTPDSLVSDSSVSSSTAYLQVDACVPEDKIRNLFVQKGIDIKSLTTKRRSGHTFAFITFFSEDDFKKCLTLDKKVKLYGKVVSFRKCEPPRKNNKQENSRRSKKPVKNGPSNQKKNKNTPSPHQKGPISVWEPIDSGNRNSKNEPTGRSSSGNNSTKSNGPRDSGRPPPRWDRNRRRSTSSGNRGRPSQRTPPPLFDRRPFPSGRYD